MKVKEMNVISLNNGLLIKLIGDDLKIVLSKNDYYLNCVTVKLGEPDYSIDGPEKPIYTKANYESDLSQANHKVKVKLDDYDRFLCII